MQLKRSFESIILWYCMSIVSGNIGFIPLRYDSIVLVNYENGSSLVLNFGAICFCYEMHKKLTGTFSE